MKLLCLIQKHDRFYAQVIPELVDRLGCCPATVMHGDLAGDNLMLGLNGRLLWSVSRRRYMLGSS